MASNESGDSSSASLTNVLNRFLSQFLLKDELRNTSLFNRQDDIDQHLRFVSEKISSLQLSDHDKVSFLMNSLHHDVRSEMQTVENFTDASKEYSTLKKFLCDLYRKKKSSVSSILELLDLRQSSNQSTRDFLSSVRITGYRVLSDVSNQDRDKFLLKAFINGLANTKFSEALQQLQPKTLTEAYEMIKNERSEFAKHDENVMKISSGTDNNYLLSTIKKMQMEINCLKNEVSALKISPNVKAAHNYKPTLNLKNRSQSQDVVCFRCNQTGHVSKYCKNRPFCPHCNAAGHSLRDCNRRNKVRQFHFESVDCNSMPGTADLIDEVVSNPDNSKEEIFQGVSSITCQKVSPRTLAKPKTYAKCVENWADYIKGSTAQPRQPLSTLQENISIKPRSIGGRTLISNTHSETAANKPIVVCRIKNRQCPILFDSGAELNVISEKFLSDLKKDNPSTKFVQGNGFLNCANGSQLKVLGYTGVTVSIGVSQILLKFTVVKDLFPKMIIGLPAMKKHAIDIIPSEDSIEVQGIKVPFMSKTRVSEN